MIGGWIVCWFKGHAYGRAKKPPGDVQYVLSEWVRVKTCTRCGHEKTVKARARRAKP